MGHGGKVIKVILLCKVILDDILLHGDDYNGKEYCFQKLLNLLASSGNRADQMWKKSYIFMILIDKVNYMDEFLLSNIVF